MKLAIALLAFALASPIAAEECPCFPHGDDWIASVCDSWNCATAEVILANGSPYVFAIPMGKENTRWLILRRVANGGVVSPEPEYKVETFADMTTASTRFSTFDQAHGAMMFSTPDGRLMVVYKNDLHPRPLRHP